MILIVSPAFTTETVNFNLYLNIYMTGKYIISMTSQSDQYNTVPRPAPVITYLKQNKQKNMKTLIYKYISR